MTYKMTYGECEECGAEDNLVHGLCEDCAPDEHEAYYEWLAAKEDANEE